MIKQSVGIKYDAGKLRYDLIPPRALEALAQVYTIGADKYSDRNWEKGIKWCRIFAAMMRHSWRWMDGEEYDQTDGQMHLASVAWCAFALLEYSHTHPELDDRSVTNRVDKGEKISVASNDLVHPIYPTVKLCCREDSHKH